VKNLTWQNPEQLFVAQELINKVKSKCCGIKDHYFSRVGRQEKCRFQESIIFNNRASYISKRKINIIANGEKENCNYILLFLSLPDILLKSIKVVSKSARKKACSSTTFVVYNN